MLDIAYLYAHHRWQATTTNIIHPPYSFTCSGKLCEQDQITQKQIWSYADSWLGQLDESAMIPKVDTPAWVLPIEGETYYEGIPYAWGLSSGVIATNIDKQSDPKIKDVFIPMGPTNRSFDELIDINHRYFAGNINTDFSNGNSWAAGVDCIGLINNVWQMGTRYGMDDTLNYYATPIKFKDLKAGDVLMNYVPGNNQESHVMLFEKFDSPLNGEPVAGQTQFSVYEASGDVWKVRHFTYIYDGIPVNKPNDVLIKNSVTGLELDGSYTPATYLPNTPKDVVIVIDKSISMQGEKLAKEKAFAKEIIGLMREKDKIAVVSFDTTPYPIYPSSTTHQDGSITWGGLATIDFSNSVDEQQAAKDAIDLYPGFIAGGGTNIGYGLFGGYSNLSYYGASDSIRMIILLTDGWSDSNTDSYYTKIIQNTPFDISQSLKDAKIQVYTIGVGVNTPGYVNEEFLKGVANDHGGGYSTLEVPMPPGPYGPSLAASGGLEESQIQPQAPQNQTYTWTDLPDIYQAFSRIWEKTYNQTIVKSIPLTTVNAGMTKEEDLTVDSAMGSMTISFLKYGVNPDLTLSLIQPNGNAVDLNAPNITHVSGTDYEKYTILAPQTGTWVMRVTSVAGGEYSFSVSTMDAMSLSFSKEKDTYLPGEPIMLTASVNDSTSGSLMASPNYILGAVMQVTAHYPNSAQEPYIFNLLDDGAHNDGAANDGIYANTFTDTSLEGVYDFNIKVSGNTNRDAQLPFTREKLLSVPVEDPPDVLSIAPASANPTNAGSVNFTVTFSEFVAGIDANDFVLTNNCVPGAAITSVNGLGATYNVTVSTGVGSCKIRLDVADNGTIVDEASNPLSGGFTSGETFTIDRTAPVVVSITRASANPTNAASVDFRVNFSEAVIGVDVSDFTLRTTGVSGASVTSVSWTDKGYIVTVNTGGGDGTIRLDVLNRIATITDVASNSLVRSFNNGEIYNVIKSTAPRITPMPSITPTPTKGLKPINTPTPPNTPMPTITPTPSKTPRPTNTPEPTITPTPTFCQDC